MVEYVKNVNIRYVTAMTFQLHSKFFQDKRIYFTDQQKELRGKSPDDRNTMVELAGELHFQSFQSCYIYLQFQSCAIV